MTPLQAGRAAMRSVLVAAWLLGVLGAAAQTVLAPATVLLEVAPVVVATGPMPAPVAGPPPCWPSFAIGIPIPGGTGSNLYWGAVGEVGSWYGWRCPVDATNVRLVSKLVRKAYKGPSIMSLVDEALTYPRLLDALPVLWNKYDAPCDKVGVTPELLAACEADMLALGGAARTGLLPPAPAAPPVPAGAWVVAPYALSKTAPPTRPVFGFQRGRRVAQTYAMAEVGQPCNLSVATVVEGALTYASFGPLFSPVEVTVCVRKP